VGDSEVAAMNVQLRPGARRVINYSVVTGPGEQGRPDLLVTPGLRSDGIGTVADSGCG